MLENSGACGYVLDPDEPETWGGEEGDECYINEETLNEDGVWTCPYMSEEEERFCIFHKPIEKKETNKALEELVSILQEYEGKGRKQDLCFYGADFHKFDLREVISDISIEGTLDLSHITVRTETILSDVKFDTGGLNLPGCRFQGDFTCEDASFIGGVSFGYSKFNGDFNVKDVEFDNKTVFFGSIFSGSASFTGCEFSGEANFINSIFQSNTSFESVFVGTSKFQNTTFEDFVDFGSTKFEQAVSYRQAEFEMGSNFRGCQFLGAANFIQAVFYGDTTFNSIIVNDEIFQRTKFHHQTNFQGSEFLAGAAFVDVLFANSVSFDTSTFNGFAQYYGSEFEGKVYFRNTDFNAGVGFIDIDFSSSPAHFTRSDLSDANFTGANLAGVDLEQTILSRATLFGADLRGAKINGAVLGDVRINEDTDFLGHSSDNRNPSPHTFSAILDRPCCVYDPSYEKGNHDNAKAKSVYRALEELAGKAAQPRLQSRCFIRRQDLQKEGYKQVMLGREEESKGGPSWEKRLIAGARYSRAKAARTALLYGESPWRIIGGSVSFIFLMAFLYPLGQWLQLPGGGPITYSRILDGEWSLLLESLYFSTLTFTTLGMGDYKPIGLGQILATLNTAFGAVLVALLVYVLGRRAAR